MVCWATPSRNFRGGGFSSHYTTKAEMPCTMIRMNLVKGLGPVLQIAATPYSMVIATLDDGMDVQTVRHDFLNNLDWQKWVCVMPTGALIAQKGNMVLCLMGADALFAQTVQAVTDCGWENLESVDSPF